MKLELKHGIRITIWGSQEWLLVWWWESNNINQVGIFIFYKLELVSVWIMVLCHGSERWSRRLSTGPTWVTEAWTKNPSIAIIARRPEQTITTKQLKNKNKNFQKHHHNKQKVLQKNWIEPFLISLSFQTWALLMSLAMPIGFRIGPPGYLWISNHIHIKYINK